MVAHTDDETNRPFGGVILCGGMSRRMGRPKADLPFGSETMLQRVVRLLSTEVVPIAVVAAAQQELPEFDSPVIVARDRLESAGPLAGIAVGLGALPSRTEAAFVTSCDVPLLRPAFVRALLTRLEGNDVVVPFDEQHLHPLAAVYRTNLVTRIERLLDQECRRPRQLFRHVKALEVPTSELRAVDPHLDTLLNLNHPADYRAALQREQLPIPSWLDEETAH